MAKEKKEKKEKKGKEEKAKEKKEKKEKKGKKGKGEQEEQPEEEKKGKKGKKKKEKKEKGKKEKSKKQKKKKGKKGEPEEPEVLEDQETPEEEEEGKKGKKKKKGKKSRKKKSGEEPEKETKKGSKKAASSKTVGKETEGAEGGEGGEAAEEAEQQQFPRWSVSWASLHLLAMLFMLCDTLWTTVLPAADWLVCLGRLAYPLFAFLLVEGFFRTTDLWRYLLRLLGVAVVSEIPFNLLYGGSAVYPLHQNVIWTYVIGLLFLILLDEVKERFGQIAMLIFLPVAALFGYFLGEVLLTDYYGAGVLIILMFYLFHGKHWGYLLGQMICLWFISFKLMGGYYYIIPYLGYDFEVVQQGLAVLSLIPIWLYYGRQGWHGKIFRGFCYLFYPAHMIILMIIRFRLLG